MCSSFVAVAGSPSSSTHRRRSQQMRSRSESARGQRRSEEGTTTAAAAAEAGRQLSRLKEDVRHWQECRRAAVEAAEAAEAEVRSLQQQTEHTSAQLELLNVQLSHQQAMQQRQLEAAETTARALSMAEGHAALQVSVNIRFPTFLCRISNRALQEQ